MQKYKFENIPQKYNQTKKELENLIARHSPVDILINKFFLHSGMTRPILIIHKPLGKIAKFSNNEILLDFGNPPKYLWLSICHETAHILFRFYGWEKSEIYKILKKSYSKKMIYSIDQSCAILLQAYCENLLKIRPLYWNSWEATFSYMDVKETAQILWPEFLKYLKEKNKTSLFDWLTETEKRGLLDDFRK